ELREDFRLNGDKIKVIYDGIEFPDTNEITPVPVEPGINTVGVISRLDSNKGLECFIDAARLILKKRNNIKFIIIGTGRIEGELKQKVKEYNITDKIIFTGFTSEKEKYNILPALDITVVPSAQEGIARSSLESMSFSKPVVATTTSSISEIITDNFSGVLVEPYSPEKLADGILRLLNSDFRQMGARARKVIEDKFSVQSFISSYEQLYNELLKVNFDTNKSFL
ncbi:MAG: glycosyltransferase family 4 protein, partial [Elusimicrobiota bacterium]